MGEMKICKSFKAERVRLHFRRNSSCSFATLKKASAAQLSRLTNLRPENESVAFYAGQSRNGQTQPAVGNGKGSISGNGQVAA